MININIQTTALISRLNQIGTNGKKESENLVKSVAKKGMAETVNATPRDQGTLKRGWHLTPFRSSSGEIIGGYSNNVEYVNAVNNGWKVYGKGKWHTGYYFLEAGMAAAELEAQKRLKRLWKDVNR